MESGLKPTNSRRPRLLIVLGLTILLGPIGIFLFVTVFSSLFSSDTTLFWQYASSFGAIIYVPLGLLILVFGLWLRQAGSHLTGLGLTLMLGPPAIFLYTLPPGIRTKIALNHVLYWQNPLTYVFALGFVMVLIGLWVRQRALRQIPR
jgi:hypothetical protein